MRTAMIAITTNNSISVKARARVGRVGMEGSSGMSEERMSGRLSATRSKPVTGPAPVPPGLPKGPAPGVKPPDLRVGEGPGVQQEFVHAPGEEADRIGVRAGSEVPVADLGVPDLDR